MRKRFELLMSTFKAKNKKQPKSTSRRRAVILAIGTVSALCIKPLHSAWLRLQESLPSARTSDQNIPAARTVQPVYLESYVDERFGSQVTRITPTVPVSEINENSSTSDTAKWYPQARHIYSKVAAWDASDRWLAVRTWASIEQRADAPSRWWLLDSQNFEAKHEMPGGFVEFRWLNQQAARCLMLRTDALVVFSLTEGVVKKFNGFAKLLSEYSDISLAGESNLSDDDKRIVFIATLKEKAVPVLLFYDLERDRLHFAMSLDIPRLDFASVSPSGEYVVANGEFVTAELDRTEVYLWGDNQPSDDEVSQPGKAVGKRWEPYGFPSHYDLTLDADGHDIAVGVSKETVGDIRAGSVIARRLDNAEVTKLVTGGYAMHTSCRNVGNRRWCFVSYLGRFPVNYPPFADELVAIAIDGSGEFRRICQFQQVEGDYWSQCQACPSTDGSMAVFASNWRGADNPVQGYVVQTGL